MKNQLIINEFYIKNNTQKNRFVYFRIILDEKTKEK